MHPVQNSCISRPTLCNKAIAGSISVLAVTIIALAIIGLAASSPGPFNAIVQLGKTANGALLGTSIFVFILDIIWLGALCKKTKEQFISKERVEEFNDTDPFCLLPDELVEMILSPLSATQQAGCGRTNQRFCRLTGGETLTKEFNPRDLSPLIKVFDASDWDKYVDMSAHELTTKDMPPCDARKTTAMLEKFLDSQVMTATEGNGETVLLTVPKGLTLRKLVKLAASPKEGYANPSMLIAPQILQKIGDIEVKHTYRIVITSNMFKNSQNLFSKDQARCMSTIGCRMPTALEAMLLHAVTFMSSGIRLYSSTVSLNYTSCSDTFSWGTTRCYVGGSSSLNPVLFFYGSGVSHISICAAGVWPVSDDINSQVFPTDLREFSDQLNYYKTHGSLF